MICIKRAITALTLLSLLLPGFGGVGRAQASTAADSKKTFTISGMVGLPGVVMRGLPGDPITDNNGAYAVTVPQGWAGSATPTKPGYSFEPPTRDYSPVNQNYKTENYGAKIITYTISGGVGAPGAVMKGLPADPIADERGVYRAEVEYGWSGRVTPSKEGYEFTPASREYQPITANCERQYYTAKVRMFVISGNVGAGGVVMNGLPGTPVTDTRGDYQVQVQHGWSGKVVPYKAGYQFEPISRTYSRVTADLRVEDYRAQVRMVTISNRIVIGGVEPVAETRVRAEPGGYTALTDQRGRYTIKVPYGWSGHLLGMDFDDHRSLGSFTNVTKDIIDGSPVSSSGQPAMVTISDWIRAGNEPIAEVKVLADPGGQSVLTNLQGRYTIQVPYGWTGRLIFSKDGFVFDPDYKSFTNVTADIIREEPAPSGKRPAPLSRTQAYPRAILPSPAGNVFVIPTAQVAPQKFAETADDLRVMLQIFREKLSEPRMIRGAFVDFGDFFNDRDRALEAFYLQGSAAVFVLEMDAPFSFTSPQASEGQATQESVDVVWQRARQKLYSPQDAARGPAGLSGETERVDFQQFKEDLLKAFRHAANLRNVEPNESVILTIIAHDESGGWPAAPASAGGSFSNRGGMWFEGGSYSSSSGTFGPSGGTSQADSRTYSRGSAASQDRTGRPQSGSAPAGPSAVLTIQARKADIDAFAKGSLSFEQFQQRVKVFTY